MNWRKMGIKRDYHLEKLIAGKNDGDVKIMWHGKCRLDIDAFTAVF